jgi:hypothetical protein
MAMRMPNPIGSRSTFWIGLALLAVTIAPIWIGTVFPSLDGPVHVYISDTLRQYTASAHLQNYFALNWHIEPNVLIYPILCILELFFDGPTSEKLLLTLIGGAFFAAAVYAVRSFHRDATWIAVLFLPAIYLHPAYLGFYNYTASLAGFLFSLGYWFRHRHNLSGVRVLPLAAIAFLVALIHLMGFVLLAFTIVVMNTVMAWLTREDGPVVCFVRSSVWLALAFVPVLPLVLDFFARYGMSSPATGETVDRLWLAKQLVTMSVLYLFHEVEVLWNLPLVVSLAYLGFLSRHTLWERPAALGLLAATGGLVVIYFANPVTTKDVPIHNRILPALFLTAILTLAACYRPELTRRYLAVAAVGAAVTIASGGSRAWHHARIDHYARDYLSLAAEIEPGSTITAFHNWRHNQLLGSERLSWRVDPFRHMAAVLALGKETAFLGASLLSRERYGYFPVFYREETDLYSPGGGWYDLRDYNRAKRTQIDYVVLWPVINNNLKPFRNVLTQMAQEYEPIAKSRPLGLAHLFRHRLAKVAGGNDTDRRPEPREDPSQTVD